MTTVTLEKLTKVYANGVVALRGLDLHVDDGEFVVLVGPSGCGKTTALRMVAGLEEITSGRLLLRGPGGQRRVAQGPGCGHGLPELRPLPTPQCL